MSRGRPRLEIEPGTRYGMLVVEARGPDQRGGDRPRTAWWCRCDCGDRAIVATCSLRRGMARSCGCLRRAAVPHPRPRSPVPVGERFGRLVVQAAGEHGPHGRSRWVCLCDCGKTAIVLAGNLKSGSVRSCGCGRKKS